MVSNSYGSFSLYGLYQAGPAYMSAVASVGYASSNFDRNLYNLGLNLATDSGLDGWILAGRFEAGYSFGLGATGASLTPFVAFQPTQLWLGSGSEMFSLGAGISYQSTAIAALPLYVAFSWTASGRRPMASRSRLICGQRGCTTSAGRDVPRSFAELPTFSFSGTSIPTVSNAADLHAGLQFLASPTTTLSASFDAQIAEGYSTFAPTGSLRVRW